MAWRRPKIHDQPAGERENDAMVRRLILVMVSATLAVVSVAAAAAGLATVDPDWRGTDPENISQSPADLAWQPAIAAGPSGKTVIAWSDPRTDVGDRDIYHVLSTNDGHTWSSPAVVVDTAQESASPDVIVTDNRAFVAWIDQQAVGGQPVALYETEIGISGLRSVTLPSGASWYPTIPRLALSPDPDRLHVAFNALQNGKSHLFYSTRLLTETAWPEATRFYTSTVPFGSWYPVLAAGPDGQTLHAVWEDHQSSTEQTIRYMSGTLSSGSIAWSPAITLSEGITLSVYAAMAVDPNGDVHVAWGEADAPITLQPGQYVRYTHYDTAAGSWDLPSTRVDNELVKINRDYPSYLTPALGAVEKNGRVIVCVAWHGYRVGGYTEAEEILLSCSMDGGDTWSTPRNVSRTTGATEISISPAVAYDAQGYLHLAWEEHAGSILSDPIVEVYHAYEYLQVFLPLTMRSY